MQGFKTFAFGITLVLLGGLQSQEFTDFVAQHPGGFSSAVGTIIIVLRFLTTTSIFKKE
jgi:hypothetical protein